MPLTLDTPLIGIQRGQQTLRSAAHDIASADLTKRANPPTLSASLVQLLEGERQSRAATKALSVELSLLGSLLDVTA